MYVISHFEVNELMVFDYAPEILRKKCINLSELTILEFLSSPFKAEDIGDKHFPALRGMPDDKW